MSRGLEPRPSQTTPGLVQALARRGAQRLRQDLAGDGMDTLRPVHALVLAPLLSGGRRASDLSELLDVSRQAVAQVVQVLETDGYVERAPDPGDARAKLICLTGRGRAALRAMRASSGALEREWAGLIGEGRLSELRSTLAALLA